VAFISVYSKSFRTKVLPELRVLSITHRMKKIITGTNSFTENIKGRWFFGN